MPLDVAPQAAPTIVTNKVWFAALGVSSKHFKLKCCTGGDVTVVEVRVLTMNNLGL